MCPHNLCQTLTLLKVVFGIMFFDSKLNWCFAMMNQIQKNGVGDARIVIGAGLASAPAILSLPLDREMGTRHKDRISPKFIRISLVHWTLHPWVFLNGLAPRQISLLPGFWKQFLRPTCFVSKQKGLQKSPF